MTFSHEFFVDTRCRRWRCLHADRFSTIWRKNFPAIIEAYSNVCLRKGENRFEFNLDFVEIRSRSLRQRTALSYFYISLYDNYSFQSIKNGAIVYESTDNLILTILLPSQFIWVNTESQKLNSWGSWNCWKVLCWFQCWWSVESMQDAIIALSKTVLNVFK